MYRGYLNAQGQRQGVGILISLFKNMGEWHEDKLHGIAKREWRSDSKWGQYKHGKREGYMTWKHSYGKPDYNQFKNDMRNGYGIETYEHG
jgi:hypothetical protein